MLDFWKSEPLRTSLSVTADVVTIVGALISLWVAITLRQIKRQYAFRARLPELMKTLRAHAKRTSDLMESFEKARTEISTAMVTLESTLRNVKARASGRPRVAAKSLIARLKRLQRPPTADEVWEVYQDVQGLIQDLQHFEKDAHWR